MLLRIYTIRGSIQDKYAWRDSIRLHKSVHERLFKRELSRLRGGYTRESSFPLISAAVDTEKKATEGNVKRKSDCLQTAACIKKASLLPLSSFFFPSRPSRSRPKGDEGKKSSLRDDERARYLLRWNTRLYGKRWEIVTPQGVFARFASVKLPAMLDTPWNTQERNFRIFFFFQRETRGKKWFLNIREREFRATFSPMCRAAPSIESRRRRCSFVDVCISR